MATAARNRATLRAKSTRRRSTRLTLDQAIIAVLIAAMDANQHVSPEEAARAHHIIWSMRRFRSRAGEYVDRLIEAVRHRIEDAGMAAVLQEACRTIPPRLRPAAFAVAVDLMLADTRLERTEKQFVGQLTAALKVRPAQADEILAVMLTKNSA